MLQESLYHLVQDTGVHRNSGLPRFPSYPRQPTAQPVYLSVHILAEPSGQALSPQDQVALMTKTIQQDVVLLILSISVVVYKGDHVPLHQTQEGNLFLIRVPGVRCLYL